MPRPAPACAGRSLTLPRSSSLVPDPGGTTSFTAAEPGSPPFGCFAGTTTIPPAVPPVGGPLRPGSQRKRRIMVAPARTSEIATEMKILRMLMILEDEGQPALVQPGEFCRPAEIPISPLFSQPRRGWQGSRMPPEQMGRFFESFDEAWAHFLLREEPLEDFYETLPAEEREIEAWVIEPSPAIKAAALELQRRLAGTGDLKALPQHFLHVTLPVPGTELRGRGPFHLEYRRLTCFHEAVAVEVHAPSLKRAYPSASFLPHLTLAITTRKTPPREIR